MKSAELNDILERSPVVAAVSESKWEAAIKSPAAVIFYLQANLLTLKQRTDQAKASKKPLFVHIDLAEGIAKDRTGLSFLAECGVDGVISTHSNIIRAAKELGLLAVQRFFALDSKGLENFYDTTQKLSPDLIEIMPGIIPKIIERFSGGRTPVIAGGLIETKQEVTSALLCGASAVSTGCEELWYI